jgi:hypothetical protein
VEACRLLREPHLSDNRDAARATDHRARCQLERSTKEP